MRAFTISLVVAGALGAAHSPGAAQGRDPSDPFDVLLRVQRLDDSAVGYAAERTPAYDAFSKLYRAGQPSLGVAKRLVGSGTPAARIYGYLILLHVSPADADIDAKRLLKDQAQVKVRSGCSIWQFTIAALVERIQNGETVIFLPTG